MEALKSHDIFISFYEIPDIKSWTIISVIKDILTKYQMSIENFRGQCSMEPVTCLEKPLGLRWNSNSFSQKQIIHTVMHTPSQKSNFWVTPWALQKKSSFWLSIPRKEKTSWEKSKNKSNVMKNWKSKQIRYPNSPKQDALFAQNVSKEFWIIIKT